MSDKLTKVTLACCAFHEQGGAWTEPHGDSQDVRDAAKVLRRKQVDYLIDHDAKAELVKARLATKVYDEMTGQTEFYVMTTKQVAAMIRGMLSDCLDPERAAERANNIACALQGVRVEG